ncbi:MAG TPA: phytanoyl-CoA dioxygenase family protein [Polyangiaceae bacterium]|nr:phytanoyl-CoA dioxygenase family protein [Polyangiaceae bacterium]
MTWIVPVSDSERLQGCLSASNAEAAYQAFCQHGCVLLRGVFEPSSVDALYREYQEQYGALDGQQMAARAEQPAPNPVAWVGERRYEILPHMGGAFGDPYLFANPLLHGLLRSLLGEMIRLSGLTLVVSYPGADKQHTHRDHPLLFGDPNVALNLPPYAINVAVPLIDVDHETGPTGIWLGSQHWADESRAVPESMTVVPFQRGDCILLDYRTLHAGVPNRGTVVRPIAYMVYTRTWFFDEINHRMRPSLGMTLEEYGNLPEEVHPLVMRVFSQHARARFFNEPHDD